MLRGGAVFDGHRHHRGTALVLDGDRVAGLVPETDVAALLRAVGPVEVRDLDGGLVLPGSTDAHAHPVQAGMERLQCDLSDLATPPAYLERVAAWAAARPADGWVLAWRLVDARVRPGGPPGARPRRRRGGAAGVPRQPLTTTAPG